MPESARVFDIVGICVSNLAEDEALGHMLSLLERQQHTKISFLNAHNANVAITDPEFGAVTSQFTWLADGIGVDLAAKWLYGEKFAANLNGTDFIPLLLARSQTPLKVGLYGAAPGIAVKAQAAFKAINTAHEINVLGHGFIDQAEQEIMLSKLEADPVDILLVAMGVPRQELWIANSVDKRHCTLAFGVGALFDFMAGHVPRAPLWMRRLRIEWTFRLMNEPIRLAKRYLIGNPVFLMRVAQYKFKESGK